MIDRRALVLGAGFAAGSGAALAQARRGTAKLAIFMDLPATDPTGITRVAALMDGLAAFGWKAGGNLLVQIRWGSEDRVQRRRDAEALLQAAPDVIVSAATPPTRELQQLTKTTPIVFTTVIDPVGAGFVESLARPGGNLTGFTNLEPSISAKWVQILLEIDPNLAGFVIVMEPGLRASKLQADSIAEAARAIGRSVSTVDLLDDNALEAAFASAATAHHGAILTSSPSATARRLLIIGAAQRYRIPTIYPGRHHIVDGALLSYGPDLVHPFRQAAGYVDRILRGESPAQLPVQLPTRQEMVLNARMASQLNIVFPASLIARAEDVID